MYFFPPRTTQHTSGGSSVVSMILAPGPTCLFCMIQPDPHSLVAGRL